jgi:hypothetical protein
MRGLLSLGVCPSGQRERAVNPSAQPTEVRILPPPLNAERTSGTSGASSTVFLSPSFARNDAQVRIALKNPEAAG